MTPEGLGRWAVERAEAGDEVALREALEALLLPFMARREAGHLRGLLAESFVRAPRLAGGPAPPEDLEVQ